MRAAMIDRAPILRRARLLAAALLAGALALAAPAAAQDEPRAPDSAEAIEDRRAERLAEYERIAREIELSEERIESLNAEVDAVKNDSASLTAALIQAAKTERKLSEDIDSIASRLERLETQESTIRESLLARRDVLAEVLGALQRMGLDPPPAILVRPEDALSAVRSAILLGAVVPELRTQTQSLAQDLRALSRVVASSQAERDRLRETVSEQVTEKRRLKLLLEEKRQARSETQTRIAQERERAEELAERAASLQELIAALELQATERKRVEEEEAERRRRREEGERAARELPEIDPRPFSDRHGDIALPVSGGFGARYGDDDDAGGSIMGDIVRTQSDAIVTAPAEGTVLYAGPFRSYGELLILNVGEGYHIVLAGMDRISVSSGQSVLSGEPVGEMGEAQLAGLSDENAAPELYIEFRKDGEPIDPAPWWTERLSGRTADET